MNQEASPRISRLDDDSARADFRRSLGHPNAVVFVGSGVSLFAPSHIPAGQVFAREMRRELLAAGMIPGEESARIERVVARIPFEVWLHYAGLVLPAVRVRDMVAELASAVQPNRAHQFLAGLLTAGITVVTPNYDSLIEHAVIGDGPDDLDSAHIDALLRAVGVVRIYNQLRRPAAAGVLLKLHGTVDHPDSLVFELRQEARLDSWKADVLQQLTRGRHLYFIGYSGSDFDILPLLLRHPPERISWLSQGADVAGISPEAVDLIKGAQGELVVGDLGLLFNMPRTGEEQQVVRSKQLLERFTRAEKAFWCGVTLVRLGLGAHGECALKEVSNPPRTRASVRLRELAWAMHHKGRYLDAIRLFGAARRDVRWDESGTVCDVSLLVDRYEAQRQRRENVASIVTALRAASRLVRHKCPRADGEDLADLVYHVSLHQLARLTRLSCPILRFARRRFVLHGERFALAGIDRYLEQLGCTPAGASSMEERGIVERYQRLGDVVGEIDSLRSEARAVIRKRGADLGLATEKLLLSIALSDDIRHPTGCAKGWEEVARAQRRALIPGDWRHSLILSRQYYYNTQVPIGLRVARRMRFAAISALPHFA